MQYFFFIVCLEGTNFDSDSIIISYRCSYALFLCAFTLNSIFPVFICSIHCNYTFCLAEPCRALFLLANWLHTICQRPALGIE
uniref:Uncharacterized protein n=1 Tax=Anguilla anguilla TaxID=7936 RepID=A0A0E9X2Z6_ANGAN